jgi:sugar phosphate isomerase/epimerase
MNRLAITSQKPDIAPHVDLARQYGVGLEIQVYGYDPNLLDDSWQDLASQHRSLLKDFPGEIALHGAFYDMTSSSVDRRLVQVTWERYLASLQVAAELGARNVVFHANYLPLIRKPSYRPDWIQRQVDFWGKLAKEASKLDVIIALENMWEPDPDLIATVLEQVASPHARACLDVGHVYLFSESLPFPDWLERTRENLVHIHANNNLGQYDDHLPLDAEEGVVNYDDVIPLLRELSPPPLVSLEMEHLEDLERSLHFLGR